MSCWILGSKGLRASRLRNSHGAWRQDMTALFLSGLGPKTRCVWHVATCSTGFEYNHFRCLLLSTDCCFFAGLSFVLCIARFCTGILHFGSPSLLLLSSVVFPASPPRLQTHSSSALLPPDHRLALFLTLKVCHSPSLLFRVLCSVQTCMHKVCQPAP